MTTLDAALAAAGAKGATVEPFAAGFAIVYLAKLATPTLLTKLQAAGVRAYVYGVEFRAGSPRPYLLVQT